MRRACLVTLAAVAALAPTPTALAQPPRPVKVSINLSAPSRPVPPLVLGLSLEASQLPQIARYADQGNMSRLLASLGPGVIRFGGVSVDTQTVWSPDGDKPSWATTAITPGDLDALARLVRQVQW